MARQAFFRPPRARFTPPYRSATTAAASAARHCQSPTAAQSGYRRAKCQAPASCVHPCVGWPDSPAGRSRSSAPA